MHKVLYARIVVGAWAKVSLAGVELLAIGKTSTIIGRGGCCIGRYVPALCWRGNEDVTTNLQGVVAFRTSRCEGESNSEWKQ